MSDPIHFIDTPALGIVCGIALAGVYGGGRLIKALGPSDRDVKPVKLELPLTSERARRLVDDWEARRQLGAAKRFVYADFLFLLSYAVAIAAAGSLAGRAVAAALDADPADATKVGAVFTYAGLLAGVLDVLENIGMLLMMGKRTRQPVPFLTTLVSAVKWVLAGVGAIGALGLLIASAVAELI